MCKSDFKSKIKTCSFNLLKIEINTIYLHILLHGELPDKKASL